MEDQIIKTEDLKEIEVTTGDKVVGGLILGGLTIVGAVGGILAWRYGKKLIAKIKSKKNDTYTVVESVDEVSEVE